MINFIENGVCAPRGFTANGLHCGIRDKTGKKKDLAFILSSVPATAAAVYTQNLVKGAPLTVTKENISDGIAQAVICNSGNANTCNANGIEIATQMCELAGKTAGIDPKNVIVASTGVIGEVLSIDPVANKIQSLVDGLESDTHNAAEAIMTTDTVPKKVAVSFKIGDTECRIGGIAKGSGMIHPNMATMLVFITSDVAITKEMLQKALSDEVKDSFNNISVDGDTSTNDMVSVMANGLAENKLIDSEGAAYDAFREALRAVTVFLCREIAGDGEGATKLLECEVKGAKDKETARTVAKSVICSSLVKTAIFGADANWGRVLCAIGYSGADLDVNKIDVSFKSDKGELPVCKNGFGIGFDEDLALKILKEQEVYIIIDLNDGSYSSTAWGCDLTYEYVKINGEYRS